ncbi:CyaY protein [Andreprevotia lacus DSM 23236]|jgi:CyaY protein|uniref:Iron-sulfur cluster assembly protein CyaY n=1 Tax=Andreprevotia lacus DSM 23236 TaxID=1121001 RepID=A0A1W1X0W7_9NEIS|nr:iron donor protein CyaY [Andreprevotia lacus]SMC17031.1 CyaY protein [Andreprevotia lacus DSM 23236]
MTESEFLDLSDAIFARIDTAFEEAGLDVETLLAGNVLEIEFDDGSKIIVNRHVPNKEMWIAAKSGGYHYRQVDGVWRNTRGEGEFFADLAAAVSQQGGEAFQF